MPDRRPPVPPPPDVEAYWQARSQRLAYGYSWRDVWGEEHAHAFTVAKAMTADVLGDIRDEVGRAIKEGTTFETFRRELEPRLQARGWWGEKRMTDPATGRERIVKLGSPRRLKTIYWANTRTARAAGLWARAQRTKKLLPYFVYGLGPSQKHREPHVRMAGVIAAIDDPVWNTWFPPSAWGCKCWLRQVTKAAAERLGVKDPPELPMREFTNDRTGETIRIPEGVDPGWHTNPGRARTTTLTREALTKLDRLARPQRSEHVAEVLGEIAGAKAQTALALREARKLRRAELMSEGVSKPDALRQVDEALPLPDDPFPVAELPERMKAVIGASDDLVFTTTASLAKRHGRRALEPEVVRRLPEFIATARVFTEPGDPSALIFAGPAEPTGDLHVVVIKASVSRTARLTTIYPADKSDLIARRLADGRWLELKK